MLKNYIKLKNEISNDELDKFKLFNTKVKESFRKLEEDYEKHV